jgi:hypothetical protein
MEDVWDGYYYSVSLKSIKRQYELGRVWKDAGEV